MADVIQILGDIEWYRGDSFSFGIRIKDKRTAEYIDLTGYSFLLTVNSEEDPSDSSKTLFQVVGVLDEDQVLNKGWVYFTPKISDTADALIDTYYYDIQLMQSVGRPRTVAKHSFTLLQDITKNQLAVNEYTTFFTNSDLVANVLTVVHDLDEKYPVITVYNNDNELVDVSAVSLDFNSFSIDFGGVIDDTWFISAKASVNRFTQIFINADLINNVLTVDHNLGTNYPNIVVYDDNQELASVTIETISKTQFTIYFGGAITGTWHLTAI